MSYEVKKTEHTGAKNGGGYWGTRQEAKDEGKKVRRANDKKAIRRACEIDILAFDGRTCARHGEVISSPDGLFDGLCGACETELAQFDSEPREPA